MALTRRSAAHSLEPAAWRKIGHGALTLTGASTYTGDTNVNAGTLFVDGSLASANTNILLRRRLWEEAGRSPETLSTGGIVSPGHSPGTITVNGNFTQSSRER